MSSEEIEKLEFEIRKRTGAGTLNLVIRHIKLDLYDRLGKAYYEWGTFQSLTPEQEMIFKKIKNFLKAEFDKSEYFLTNNDFSIRKGIYHVLVELTGLFLGKVHARLAGGFVHLIELTLAFVAVHITLEVCLAGRVGSLLLDLQLRSLPRCERFEFRFAQASRIAGAAGKNQCCGRNDRCDASKCRCFHNQL